MKYYRLTRAASLEGLAAWVPIEIEYTDPQKACELAEKTIRTHGEIRLCLCDTRREPHCTEVARWGKVGNAIVRTGSVDGLPILPSLAQQQQQIQ